MKFLTKEEVIKITKNLQKQYHNTYWSNRKIEVTNEFTKKGKRIIDSASRNIGDTIYQVYDNPSDAKKSAYTEVLLMYSESKTSEAFSICSKNTYQFTVSWVDNNLVYYVTRDKVYIVVCDC